MEWLVIAIFAFLIILLIVVLILETIQYRRILAAAISIDGKDLEYHNMIKDLGSVVNNHAEVLGDLEKAINESNGRLETISFATGVHGELIKLIAGVKEVTE